jgi:hypothetical protein
VSKAGGIKGRFIRLVHHPAVQGTLGLLLLAAALWALGSEMRECAEKGRSLLNLSGEASFVLLVFAFLLSLALTLDPIVDGLELVEDAVDEAEHGCLDRFNCAMRRVLCSPHFHLGLGILIIAGGAIEIVLDLTAPEGRFEFWSLGMAYFGLRAACDMLARLKKTLGLAGESLARQPLFIRLALGLSRFLTQPWLSAGLALVILITGLADGAINRWLFGLEADTAAGLTGGNLGIAALAANTVLRNLLVIKDAEEVVDDEISKALAGT